MSPPLAAAPARPAATTILLMPGAPLEVFLVKRVRTQRFMGGAHVFPGGAMDPADLELVRQQLVAHPGAAVLAQRMRLPEEEALSYVAAAARELLEEAGVLLCRHTDAGEAREVRQALLEGTSLAEALQARNLVLDGEMLHYVAHWITPLGEPKRFDTRFFVAALPEAQQASADEQEALEGEWMAPAQAVASHLERRIVLPPPTLCMLDWLGRLPSLKDALMDLPSAVKTVLPEVHTVEDRLVIAFPGDPLHPDPEGVPGAPTRVEMRDGVWAPFRFARELKS